MNPLKRLGQFGQSPWFDYIRRDLIAGGQLARMIEDDGLRGVTSNPAIFEKAITGSGDYKTAIADLAKDASLDAKSLYERLAVEDVRAAADVLRPVYVGSERRDGYVSLEVSPTLAKDTQGTLVEARRLWKAVGRENVMIKVPATKQGGPAIEALLAEGINVNVTLLFASDAWHAVAEAYLRGIERAAAAGCDLSRIQSVASFFVSRIDSAVDAIVRGRLAHAQPAEESMLLRSIEGKVAIANAKLVYERWQRFFAQPRWKALEAKGAHTQRLLWASTGTKDPKYRDVLYVEELIGPDTVNTLPPATYEAFRDHGQHRASLASNLEEAHEVMETVERLGISFAEVTDKLLADGLRLFEEPFAKLLAAVDAARRAVAEAGPTPTELRLPAAIAKKVTAALDEWKATARANRLWARDASLWTNQDESQWLGWLGIVEDQIAHIDHLNDAAALAKDMKHVVVLGMGGSSLCPDVLSRTFGTLAGRPQLLVLDSTDPAQIRALESRIDLTRTLFIVSSKSGSTLEPNIFQAYFYDRVKAAVGEQDVGSRFVAVTDPGSKVEAVAAGLRFARTYHGVPSIGGRYSALSDFGMLPAAAMGLDVAKFLDRAERMVHACAGCVPADQNPGVVLGVALGVLQKQGRDKLTLIVSPAISSLGAWLEQLVAESTGKLGKSLIPVDGETVGPPACYGDDRVFAYVRTTAKPDAAQDAAVAALEAAGQPVIRIAVHDPMDLGGEFFRWEIATAVAGSVIGINPFDQPDVEASKLATRRLTSEYEKNGSLPAEAPVAKADGLSLFSDARNADQLTRASGGALSVASGIAAHIARLSAGDYFGLLAYLNMSPEFEAMLQKIRIGVRDRKRVATCLGFGPRFLHSTGQAYKGGPNSGVFLQVTCDDANDLQVPGWKFSFGVVKSAQARGDFEVLAERGRRALRVHLGSDVKRGLTELGNLIEKSLV